MFNNNKLYTKKKNSNFFLITTFIIFLIPYSISGLSANYSFIFFPLILILISGKIKTPSKNIILITLFFILVLLISTLYQYELLRYLDRRLISFLIFMSIFSYTTIDIDRDKINSFKIAIVLIVLFFAIYKLGKYIYWKNLDVGNLKHYVGSSRYGFVYILAFWITWFYQPHSKFFKILKSPIILLILVGIFLTFSRTTILALFVSFFFYYLTYFSLKKKNFIFRIIFIILIPIIFLIIIYSLSIIFPWGVKYFSNTILIFLSVDGLIDLFQRFTEMGTSEGFRVFILGKILNFVSYNPLTGSGFLGCWIMFDDLKCSAHNQYSDVLFRTGLIGFCFYMYILYQIYKFLRDNHPDLLYGYIGILVYGFFHETFKLSQGGFIIAFLLGAMASTKREINSKFIKNQDKYNKQNKIVSKNI